MMLMMNMVRVIMVMMMLKRNYREFHVVTYVRFFLVEVLVENEFCRPSVCFIREKMLTREALFVEV